MKIYYHRILKDYYFEFDGKLHELIFDSSLNPSSVKWDDFHPKTNRKNLILITEV